MDSGYIIFIGLIVISLISNLVKAVKKAQQSQSKPQQMRQQPTEATVARNIPEMRRNKAKAVKPVFVPSSPLPSEGERQIFVEEEKNPIVKIAEEYDFHNVSEIKKGIIFSEIFNRKY